MRELAKRASWTLADQVMSSGTNFLAAIVIARASSPAFFGAYSLFFAFYLVTLGVSRSLATDVMGVRYSFSIPSRAQRASAAAAGTSLGVGLTAATGLFFTALAIDVAPTNARFFTALGFLLPGMLLQDAWRFIFFATQRPQSAFYNDASWLFTFMAAVVALSIFGLDSGLSVLLAWAGSGAVTGILGCLQAATLPDIRASRHWISRHRHLSFNFLGEFLAVSGSGQLVTVLVAAAAGLPAAGALRGAGIVFGPISMLLMGLNAVLTPEGARMRERRCGVLTSVLSLASLLLAALTLVWGMLFATLLPDQLGVRFVGATWEEAKQVLWPMTFLMVGTAATVGAAVGLRVLERARAAFKIRVAIAPLVLGGGGCGALLNGAVGAATGMAIAANIGAFVWWLKYWSVRPGD